MGLYLETNWNLKVILYLGMERLGSIILTYWEIKKPIEHSFLRHVTCSCIMKLKSNGLEIIKWLIQS